MTGTLGAPARCRVVTAQGVLRARAARLPRTGEDRIPATMDDDGVARPVTMAGVTVAAAVLAGGAGSARRTVGPRRRRPPPSRSPASDAAASTTLVALIAIAVVAPLALAASGR